MKNQIAINDLVNPDDVWSLANMRLFNEKGFIEPLFRSLDDIPEGARIAVFTSTKVVLKSMLKPGSFEKLEKNGAFNIQ